MRLVTEFVCKTSGGPNGEAQASSGKITRHRLNRSGDRQANHALWRIALTRMRNDERTRCYVERRLAEGKSKLEIMRMLKRYIAREVYRILRPV